MWVSTIWPPVQAVSLRSGKVLICTTSAWEQPALLGVNYSLFTVEVMKVSDRPVSVREVTRMIWASAKVFVVWVIMLLCFIHKGCVFLLSAFLCCLTDGLALSLVRILWSSTVVLGRKKRL